MGLDASEANIRPTGIPDPCLVSGSLGWIFLAGGGDGDGISCMYFEGEEESKSDSANL